MQNKRAMQKPWIMTNWDIQMERVQQKLNSHKAFRAARVSQQIPWKEVSYDKAMWDRLEGKQ